MCCGRARDDGLIHVSRDGGKTWTNVTPPAIGEVHARSRSSRRRTSTPARRTSPRIAISRTTSSRTSSRRPTTARRGRGSTTGIPDGAYTRAIREDPVRRGLLYAGTETGVYSRSTTARSGSRCSSTCRARRVRDLDDSRRRSHRRDARPRVLGPRRHRRRCASSPTACATRAVHLFAPDTAIRFAGGWARTQSSAGENPPAGVIVDYWLKQRARRATACKLEFLDASGKVIRRFVERAARRIRCTSAALTRRVADSSAPGRRVRETAAATRCRTKPRGIARDRRRHAGVRAERFDRHDAGRAQSVRVGSALSGARSSRRTS